MSQWEIRIHESVPDDSRSWVDYVNVSWPNVISRIRVKEYAYGYELEVSCRNRKFLDRCENISRGIRACWDAAASNRYSRYAIPEIEKTKDFGPYYASINTNKNDYDTIIKFVQMLKEFEDIDNEIYQYILADLKLSQQENEIAEEVNQLISDPSTDNIKKACEIAKNAQNKGYYEVIWGLAKSFNESLEQGKEPLIPIELKLTLFESISEKNPHYKDANLELFGLYASRNPNPTETEHENFLEKKLRVAIRSSQQQLINQAFNQLAHNPLAVTSTPIIGDEDTLVFLAKQIRSMRQENEKLKSYQVKAEAAKAAERRNMNGIWKPKEISRPENKTLAGSSTPKCN